MPLTVTPLPEQAVWALPVADTRSPLSSVLLRAGSSGLAIDAGIGADFPILEVASPAGPRAQVGLMAGAFMQFGAGGELTFDLQTFDGVFGLPVDVRTGPWSARAEWVHISAHYGDGIRKSGAHPENLDPYSRELIALIGSRDLTLPRVLDARVYLGGHGLIHSLPAADPLALQVGVEAAGPWPLAPFLAGDLQLAQEYAWSPALTGQLGAAYTTSHGRFRLAVAGRTGPDETGKTAGTAEQWIGLMFGFDRTGSFGAHTGPDRVASR